MAAKKKSPKKNDSLYIQETLGEKFGVSTTVNALKVRETKFRIEGNLFASKPERPELPQLIMPRLNQLRRL